MNKHVICSCTTVSLLKSGEMSASVVVDYVAPGTESVDLDDCIETRWGWVIQVIRYKTVSTP